MNSSGATYFRRGVLCRVQYRVALFERSLWGPQKRKSLSEMLHHPASLHRSHQHKHQYCPSSAGV